MSGPLQPGPPATTADLAAARERQRLVETELPRVRSAATAWRNGLAALLTALVGFGLIKGRSDVSDLDQHWAIADGCVLAGALVAGAIGAFLLIRSANGRPSVAALDQLTSRSIADHTEALDAAAALRAGIITTFACAVLLVTAVGITWYGPARNGPYLEVTDTTGTHCGSLIQHATTTIRLQTDDGPVDIDNTQLVSIRAVNSCPTP